MKKANWTYFVLPIGIVIAALAFLPALLGGSGVSAQNDDSCTPNRFRGQWPLTDFCSVSIDFDEVLSGGPPRDGIPAVDNPDMESVEEASEWLNPQSPVISVEIDGDARAYPQAILMWHEIANDEVGGVPVSVTFCPLCNSSIVFDRRFDGQVLTFGVSGLLRNSDMIMFDRETETWWQQFIGQGIVGQYNEEFLDIVPSQVIGFGQFAEEFPDGLVMSRNTGTSRSYGVNPYTGLDDNASGVIGLFQGEYDDRLPDRSRVLAVDLDGELIAYPFGVLRDEIAINDTVGETEVVAFWQPGVASSLDTRNIDDGRDIGTASLFDRTLEDGTVLTFTWDAENNVLVDDQTGSTWDLFGNATSGDLEGEQLRLLVAAPHYWFAWAAFHPDTDVYTVDAE
ncbi:MAG: DUF3179 domain-containing protein [Chloroflexota bacterium]